MNKENIRLSDDLADVITGRPHEFFVGAEKFRLWPVTLAKTLLLRPYMKALGIAEHLKTQNPYVAALGLVARERAHCCMVLSIHTMENTRAAFMDTDLREQRSKLFAERIGDDDLAKLLQLAMMSDKTVYLETELGVTKELGRLKEALAVKKRNNSLTFCGKTPFGRFIVPLKEMGFSVDEILFECGCSFLSLALSDKQVDLYMTDEELLSLSGSTGALIDGEAADADEKLRAYAISKGLSF